MKFSHNKSVGLLIIRIVVGVVFIFFGYMKAIDMPGTITMFAGMGISAFWAYVATYVEIIGGVSLILGFGTKIAGILLGITMIVATYKVIPAGFMMAAFPLTLGAVSIGLVFIGSGRFSIGASCGCPCKEGACPVK
jgi:uncharacterized membrane protein YphA (DoxX/SURF4 family)